MLALSVPLANSIKKIDSSPSKYLTKDTITKLKDEGKELTSSNGYIFATQLFKLGIASVAAVPKAIMTASGMPYIVNMFEQKKCKNEQNISFHGATEKTAKGIGNIINKDRMLKFTEKFKNSNFPMHITAITDTIATLAFMFQANKSNKIENKRKKALLYNAGISTTLSIAGGYTIDKILDKPTEKFIEKFSKINHGDKNLNKQIQGIRIAKPFLILGTIYYAFIPVLSTFLAEKADKNYIKNKRDF
jgi:xanthine/uracil/vitamin C permease (AzgA family)